MKSLYYSTLLDKHLTPFGWLTDDELDQWDRQEEAWRASQKKHTPIQLAQIFPEAKRLIKRSLKNEIKQWKQDLDKSLEVRRIFNKKILSKVSHQNQWFYEWVRDEFYVNPLKEGRKELIKKNYYILKFLSQPKEETNKINDTDIEQARQVPIDLYIQFNRQGYAPCINHNEKTPSMYYSKKRNRVHCFGCDFDTDVIGVVQKLKGVGFIEAIKIILNK